MADFKDYADQLQQEVVTDMAESYFGARKDVDDMLEVFNSMTEELRQLGPKLSQAAARLHCLLLDRDTAKNFYISLDVVPSCIPYTDEVPRPFFDELPFAFTGVGRYERCVFRAYDLLQKTADEYLNGKYFDDPDHKGRKRLTVHYLRLLALAEHINEEIARVNATTIGGTLQYVKGMDPETMQRERMMGDSMSGEDSMSKDMTFEPINFDELGLLVVQDLPSLYKVKGLIRNFCREFYGKRREDIVKAMHFLKSK